MLVMNKHHVLGAFIVSLGAIELLAWHFKVRWWIFTRNERRIARERGEEAVFKRRLVAGVTGLAVGLITFFWGNF